MNDLARVILPLAVVGALAGCGSSPADSTDAPQTSNPEVSSGAPSGGAHRPRHSVSAGDSAAAPAAADPTSLDAEPGAPCTGAPLTTSDFAALASGPYEPISIKDQDEPVNHAKRVGGDAVRETASRSCRTEAGATTCTPWAADALRIADPQTGEPSWVSADYAGTKIGVYLGVETPSTKVGSPQPTAPDFELAFYRGAEIMADEGAGSFVGRVFHQGVAKRVASPQSLATTTATKFTSALWDAYGGTTDDSRGPVRIHLHRTCAKMSYSILSSVRDFGGGLRTWDEAGVSYRVVIP